MDILSVFHILLGMAEKAINAPPNFDEMIESIYDAIAEKRAALLKDIRLSKREFVEDLNTPGSESQRRQNTILLLFLAYLLAMEEYLQLYQAVMEQKKAYAAAMQYILESMEIMARSRQNWEQGMLDDEQKRMINLMNLYQNQLTQLQNHMHELHQRHADISERLLNTANTINSITMEKTEKIANILTESSQKQIEALDNLSLNLNRVLNENIELRNQTEAQLARSDLSGQQREELTTDVARYTEKIEKIEHARELVEQQKQDVAEQTQMYQQKIQDVREHAAASTDPKSLVDDSLKMTLITENFILDRGKIAEATSNFGEDLRGLGLDEAIMDFNAAVASNMQTAEREIESIVDQYNPVLTSSLSEFKTLLGQEMDIKKGLDSVAKEVEYLQHEVKELRIDVKSYDRSNTNQPPTPPSNDNYPRL